MGTKTDNSLNLKNNRGGASRFSDTVMHPGCYENLGATSQLYQFDPTLMMHFLLFSHSCPIVSLFFSRYNAATVPSALPITDWLEQRIQLDQNLADGFPAGIFTYTDTTPVRVGARGHGATLTNGVEVEGYYLLGILEPRGLEGVGGPLTCSLRALFICEAAIMSGQQRTSEAEDVSDFTTYTLRRPILLHEPDYTQAIKDNDNIFVTADGFGSTLEFKVVGLFQETAFA